MRPWAKWLCDHRMWWLLVVFWVLVQVPLSICHALLQVPVKSAKLLWSDWRADMQALKAAKR